MGGGTRGSRPTYSSSGQTSMNKQVTSYDSNGENQESRKRAIVSFHMEDQYAKKLFIHQAKDEKYNLDFVNYTKDEPFDSNWRAQWRERMNKSSTLIVMIGPETHKREAVNWEINTARAMGKKVIGVRIHRYENHQVPNTMQDNNTKVMNWDLDKVSNEINND